MISDNFQFNEFIEAVVDKDIPVVITLAEEEANAAEALLTDVGDYNGQARQYINQLKSFVIFTYSVLKISGDTEEEREIKGVSEWTFTACRGICAKLVEKNKVPEDVMVLFD